METIRRRVPFGRSSADDSEEDEKRILDEQEQEALIKQLKATNRASSQRYMLILQVVLVLSFVLYVPQVFSFYKNPLLVMIPPETPDHPGDLPLPSILTFINIVIHINLAYIVFRDKFTRRNKLSEAGTHLLPYRVAYACAAVPPALCMYLGKSWQSTAWWGLTVAILFTVQTVIAAIDQGNESISELESLRYVSPGA
ncbi:hypothetical protein FPV67DRAFT_1410094 [Lyophyllum atratum]|nr:hypothetical protein FPV67DRAFT_1410094 [Lyophyllum atratum]